MNLSPTRRRMRALDPHIMEAAGYFGADPNFIRALIHVESHARRVASRFEAHVFPNHADGAEAPNYAKALTINADAANAATSHGLFQIMGFWAEDLGYRSAGVMRSRFFGRGGVEEQFRAFKKFVDLTPAMRTALVAGDIDRFSALWNGRDYARLGFHTKLRSAYRDYSGGGEPPSVIHPGSKGHLVYDLQIRLIELGYDSVRLNAWYDERTETAVRAFQSASDLTVDGVVGAQTAAALKLDLSEPRPSWLVRVWRRVVIIALAVGGALATFAQAVAETVMATLSWLGAQASYVGRAAWDFIVGGFPESVLWVGGALFAAGLFGLANRYYDLKPHRRPSAQPDPLRQRTSAAPAPPRPRPGPSPQAFGLVDGAFLDDAFPPDERPMTPPRRGRASPPPRPATVVTTRSS